MSGLLVALAAQIILGSADAFDKTLLSKRLPGRQTGVFDPFAYTFGVALLGDAEGLYGAMAYLRHIF